ncbi:MAG: glucose-6-phosphate isomerase [Balneolaceae bacterium]|nr:MAG: glucose-6-phosphate isomerase [Balneolaceae bacterium]
MIKFNSDDLDNFLSVSDRAEAYLKAEKAYKDLCEGNIPGSEWLGWRRIVAEPDDAEIEEIVSYASAVRQNADIFIVCGIGGSYTGAMAVIRALNPHFGHNGPEILYAGHHMSGKYLSELIQYIGTPFEDGRKKSVYLNVISKSGTTLETALAFRQLRRWMHDNYEDAGKRIIATTGPSGGVLNKIIKAEGYKKYVIPDDVGGRFSVLTPVGLLPIAVAGIDIRTLFYGAVSCFRKESENIGNLFEYAAARYLLHEKGFAVDVIGTFEPELFGITAWIQQLIGESEGKDGMGLYPALSGFSTDLHSVGQLIQQGRRNICETLIVVDEPVSDYVVDEGNSEDTDQLNYLAGRPFHEINRSALQGTVLAHTEGGVPVFIIELDKLTAQGLGELIYFYELFTAVYVLMLGVNPFNQPGVEDYKKAMYSILGKK